MAELVRYEAARHALAEARRVDEVKGIRDKAVAMQVYAKLAKDSTLIEHATDIRMRAEIRAGELLTQMEKNKGTRSQLDGRDSSGGSKKRPPENPAPKLSDLGVTKTQSSRWQKLAALSSKEQEQKIEQAKRKAEAAVDVSPRTAQPTPKKKTRDPIANGRAISIADRCTMAVRPIILRAIGALLPNELPELFAALRDEIDDLEKVAEKRKSDGHHAARKSA